MAFVEVSEGTHVADSDSVTVRIAGELWIKSAEAAGHERSTVESYQQRLNLHIVPFIGNQKLSRLSVPAVRAFPTGCARKGGQLRCQEVLTALGAIISDAQERGLAIRNPVRR